jgi:8-oxo-dGTP diphosphatase
MGTPSLPGEEGAVIRVAAGILFRGGRVLICQRREDGAFPLKWEFPGGKLKEGESDEAALCRELSEELDVTVHPGDVRRVETIRHRYPGGPEVDLHFFAVDAFSGEPVNRAFQTLAWVPAKDLDRYDFLEADRPLVARLAAGGVVSPG